MGYEIGVDKENIKKIFNDTFQTPELIKTFEVFFKKYIDRIQRKKKIHEDEQIKMASILLKNIANEIKHGIQISINDYDLREKFYKSNSFLKSNSKLPDICSFFERILKDYNSYFFEPSYDWNQIFNLDKKFDPIADLFENALNDYSYISDLLTGQLKGGSNYRKGKKITREHFKFYLDILEFEMVNGKIYDGEKRSLSYYIRKASDSKIKQQSYNDFRDSDYKQKKILVNLLKKGINKEKILDTYNKFKGTTI